MSDRARPVISLLGAVLGAGILSACFATRSDMRVLQQDIQTARLEAQRADSARARQLDAVSRLIGVVSDSVRELQTRVNRVQGDMRGEFREVQEQLIQIQELTGQSQRRLLDLRAEMEQRNQQMQQQAPPPAPGDSGKAPPVAATTPAAPGPAQLLSLGRQQLAQRSYGTARAAFDELLRTYPESDLAPVAQLHIGETWAGEGNAAAADAAYNAVAAKYPSSASAPNALYKLGLSMANQGKRAEARLFMERVVRAYPQSDAARLADDWLKANR
ncbi:MAG: tol-pal system protein YbgF [Gemmatimonadaceae bacterium]